MKKTVGQEDSPEEKFNREGVKEQKKVVWC